MIKNKISEEKTIIKYLFKQGFREITEQEKSLPEYKSSIESAKKVLAEKAKKKIKK
jgi:hypothetical protein